jgi:hypothetical protein
LQEYVRRERLEYKFGGFRNSTAYSGTSIGDSGVSEKAGEIGQSAIMPSGDVGAWQLNADGKAIF